MSTIKLFKENNNVFSNIDKNIDFTQVIKALTPYVPEKDRATFETLANLKNIMETFEQYKDLFDISSAETLFETFSGGMSDGSQ